MDGKPIWHRIDKLFADQDGRYVAVRLDLWSSTSPDKPRLLVYKVPPRFPPDGEADGALYPIAVFANQEIHTFLGFYKDRAVFVDHSLWFGP